MFQSRKTPNPVNPPRASFPTHPRGRLTRDPQAAGKATRSPDLCQDLHRQPRGHPRGADELFPLGPRAPRASLALGFSEHPPLPMGRTQPAGCAVPSMSSRSCRWGQIAKIPHRQLQSCSETSGTSSKDRAPSVSLAAVATLAPAPVNPQSCRFCTRSWHGLPRGGKPRGCSVPGCRGRTKRCRSPGPRRPPPFWVALPKSRRPGDEILGFGCESGRFGDSTGPADAFSLRLRCCRQVTTRWVLLCAKGIKPNRLVSGRHSDKRRGNESHLLWSCEHGAAAPPSPSPRLSAAAGPPWHHLHPTPCQHPWVPAPAFHPAPTPWCEGAPAPAAPSLCPFGAGCPAPSSPSVPPQQRSLFHPPLCLRVRVPPQPARPHATEAAWPWLSSLPQEGFFRASFSWDALHGAPKQVPP